MPWPVWRVWVSKCATLEEMERHWNICDLLDANEVLDVKEDGEYLANQRMEMNRGNG